MKGKEIKGRTRISCPLCGALTWQSCFEKEKPLLRMLTQWSPGFRQFRYQENKQPEMLQRLYSYLVQKVEDLYEKLTGINIQKLLAGAGGEIEWEKSKSVLTQPVLTTGWLKTENLSNRKKPSAIETGYHQKVLTKSLTQC